MKEMQDTSSSYNELVTNQPSVERGSPHIWFFHAMLKTTEKTLTNKIKDGGVSLADQETAEAMKTIRTNVENSTVIELDKSM